MNGFDGVHERHGVSQRNLEEITLPLFCLDKKICVKHMA